MRLFSLLILVAKAAAFQAPPAPQTPTAMGIIEGRVVDAVTGEPVRKANVTLNSRAPRGVAMNRLAVSGRMMVGAEPALNGDPTMARRMVRPNSATIITDASGNFQATVPAGDYQGFAERTGYLNSGMGMPMATITVAAGETARGLTIKLYKHGVIAGRVLDEDGEPVAHVQVMTLRWMLQNGQRMLVPRGNGSSNDLGEYRVFGLAPGKYFVVAQAQLRGDSQNRLMYAPVFFPGVTEVGSAQAIEVTAGSTRQGTDLRLQKVPVVKVSGKVTGLPGDKAGPERRGGVAGGAMVTLVPRGSAVMPMGGQHSAGVMPNGEFEMPNVPAGAYVMRVTTHGPNQDRRTARMNLDVNDRDISGVSLAVEPNVELKGQVRAEGSPAFGGTMVFLEFEGMGGASSYGRPESDGRFSVANLSREVYRVRMQNPPAGYYVKSILFGTQPIQQSLDLTAGMAGELVVTLEKGTAELSGTVIGKDQKPASGVMVAIFNDRNESVRNVMSDANGQYQLTELPPGDYRVAAGNMDIQDPESVSQAAAGGLKVTLASAAKETRQIEVK